MTETFRIDDSDRFSRTQLIPWWEQARLRSAKLMVVGAGAIGNEVIKNLALLGIGNLTIIDQDRVEGCNLSRSVLFRNEDCGSWKAEAAARRAKELYPEGNFIPLVGNVCNDIGLGLFSQMDMVLGCLDNREARLWVNQACWRVGKPWIDSGIQEIHGVVQAFAARSAPCYECGMKDLDYQLMAARYACHGSAEHPFAIGEIPTTPTIASIIGGIQSQWVVKAIHGLPIPWGKALVFNGTSDTIYQTTLPEKEGCLSHEGWMVSVTAKADARNQKVNQFLKAISMQLSEDVSELYLERPIGVRSQCLQCGEIKSLSKPQHRSVPLEKCDKCSGHSILQKLEQVDVDSLESQWTLAELGIPKGDWVRVKTGKGVCMVAIE